MNPHTPHDPRATHRRWARFAHLLMLGTLLAIATVARAAEAPPRPNAATDPFEPTVTPRESELLQQALDQAEHDLPAAIALLRDADRPTASPALNYALANLYVQTNRLDEAATAYDAALRKLPRFRAALSNLARVRLMQDRADLAIASLTALVQDGQADAETYLLLGHALALTARPLSAEGAYRQALLLRPDDADARRGLAKGLIDQQRFPEAAALVQELLRARPQDAELWSLQASLALTRAQDDAAVIALETARRLNAVTPDMLTMLGDLYLNRRQPQEAIAAFNAALAAGADGIALHLRAAEGLLMLDSRAAAKRFLDELQAQSTAHPHRLTAAQKTTLRRLGADLARRDGRLDDARESYCALVRENPLDGDALLALGDLTRETGTPEGALLAYERAGRIAGFETRALVKQAEVEVAREQYPRAVALLEAAQALEPHPHVARYLEQVRELVK